MYEVIAAPPSEAGAAKLTRRLRRSPGDGGHAGRRARAPVRGVTAADGADAAPCPAPLCAVTVNV